MSNPLLVYLAAPYEDAASVAGWHTQLAGVGCSCVDTWSTGTVPPDLSDPVAARVAATAQETQILGAHLIAVNARTGVGTEMFSMLRFGYDCGLPIVYAGPLILSACRPGIAQVASLAAARTYLAALVTAMQTTIDSGNLIAIRSAIRAYIG